MGRAFLAVLLVLLAAAARAAALTPPSLLARRDYTGMGTWVAVADTNGDKIPDLIGEGIYAGVTVLLGNGNGTFRQGPSSDLGMKDFLHFVAADMNGDGVPDLVLAGGLNSLVAPEGVGVCFGNGDGTFQPAVFYAGGTDKYIGTPVVGDFNGDGIPDAATVGGSGIWLFTGAGGGVLNPGVLIPFAGSGNGANNIVAADFNGDGKLDLLVTTLTGFAVLLGNGNGTFQPQISFSTPAPPGWIATGDINMDGNQDIAVIPANSNYVFLYLGNGKGGFSGPTYADLPGAVGFAIGDVNGDGIPDLVSSYSYVALGRGNGTFKPPVFYPVAAGLFPDVNVVLADLRQDGLTDIVAQTGTGDIVSVLLNEGKGSFEDGEPTAVTGGGGCGAAADFNGDGKPDLAVNNSQGISILLGTGKATAPFTAGATMALSGADCLVTGDLNGDGIPDLLVPTATSVVGYLGSGHGTFIAAAPTAVSAPGFLAVADFNGDGKLDFATTGNLMALGNGDGTFQSPVTLTANPPVEGFSHVASADLNGDGWPDLVITAQFQNEVYVLLNNQHGGFNETIIQTGVATGPVNVALADVNGDGKLDMVLQLYYGGAMIYLGNGKGGFTYKETLSGADTLSGTVMVSDVNGDGIPDIELLNENTLAIFLGEGKGAFASPFFIGAGAQPGDLLVQNLHGQTAAGVPDIVIPDLAQGVVVLLNLTK